MLFSGISASQNYGLLSREYFYSNDRDTECKYLYFMMLDSTDRFNKRILPFTANIFQNMLIIYQKILTSDSKAGCQFTPSCSRYSYMALGRYGFIKGSVYMFDRLWRCNSQAYLYYPVYHNYLFDLPQKYNDNLKPVTASSIQGAGYVKWLINKKEYDAAYRKLLEEEYKAAAQDNKLLLARLSIIKGDYQKAAEWLEGLNSEDAGLIKADSYYLMNNFEKAKETIIPYFHANKGIEPKLACLWLHSFIEEPGKAGDKLIDTVLSAVDNVDSRLRLRDLIYDNVLNKPNGTFSLICSAIIPGSGQIINNQIEDGIYAFLFVSAFGMLTANSIIKKQYGESALFGLGFALTYSANLMAALNAPLKRQRFYLNLIHIELNKIFDPFSFTLNLNIQ